MIDSFTGKYRFLSNFWPVTVVYEDLIYPSVENAYQAAKILNLDLRKVFTEMSAKEAKRFSKALVFRNDWEEIKLGVMENLIRQKFCGSELRELLLETGTQELVEGNWWGDCFWGVCKGKGENHLGKLLMKIREEIR